MTGAHSFSATEWLARLIPKIAKFTATRWSVFALKRDWRFGSEIRAATETGAWCWLELRASAMGEGDSVDRYLGLIADVTTRKEADAGAPRDRDTLTGLRNRLGLVEELENLGGELGSAILALMDIDRFKTIHASLGDAGGDSILISVAKRLVEFASGRAQVFRVGGDGFALLFARADTNAPAIGERIVAA